MGPLIKADSIYPLITFSFKSKLCSTAFVLAFCIKILFPDLVVTIHDSTSVEFILHFDHFHQMLSILNVLIDLLWEDESGHSLIAIKYIRFKFLNQN